MSDCEHIGDWDFRKSLTLNFITVRCVECGIETNIAMPIFEAGLVTGNLIRQSWGQPKDYVPPVPDTVEMLLSRIDGN